jgi:hypothetical protein
MRMLRYWALACACVCATPAWALDGVWGSAGFGPMMSSDEAGIAKLAVFARRGEQLFAVRGLWHYSCSYEDANAVDYECSKSTSLLYGRQWVTSFAIFYAMTGLGHTSGDRYEAQLEPNDSLLGLSGSGKARRTSYNAISLPIDLGVRWNAGRFIGFDMSAVAELGDDTTYWGAVGTLNFGYLPR